MDELDLDKLKAVAEAAIEAAKEGDAYTAWADADEVADGVFKAGECEFVVACSPPTVLALIARVRRAEAAISAQMKCGNRCAALVIAHGRLGKP